MKYLLAFLEVESFGLFTILFCLALIPERDLSKRVEMDRVEEDMMISSSFRSPIHKIKALCVFFYVSINESRCSML